MEWDFPNPEDDPKYRKDYDALFGSGSFERDFLAKRIKDEFKPTETITETDSKQYRLKSRFYWDWDKSVVVQKESKFVGVACLAAKEVGNAESYVRRFGLQFEKDIQWKAVSGLLEHLAQSPLFKAVLVTSSKIPFKLEPDVPKQLQGRLNWTNRNYQFHKSKVNAIKQQVESQNWSTEFGASPYLTEQLGQEEINAKSFMDELSAIEAKQQNHLKPYYQIKDKLFTACLLFYIYTSEYDTAEAALQEIIRKKYSTTMEMTKAYFINCIDVTDPEIVFTGFLPKDELLRTYGGLALSEDVAGFNSDKDVATPLRKFFTTALETPKEEALIEEKIHVPTDEVSIEGHRKAYIGHVVESVVKNQVTKRRVYFPIDTLVRHAVTYGVTRSGKSLLALILIREALANGIKVVVFDPHGSIASRLRNNGNLVIFRVTGEITDKLREIYDTASSWEETTQLKLLFVLDETRLLKAKNLVNCLNELGKRGVGFLLITQYSTSLPPEARSVGTYFILSSMTEVEMQRFKDVTLHPSSNLISRLPRATSFVFSPYFYSEPFLVRHRLVQ